MGQPVNITVSMRHSTSNQKEPSVETKTVGFEVHQVVLGSNHSLSLFQLYIGA